MIVREDSHEWITRPHAPDEPARHVSELSDRVGFEHTRANVWRYEPGAAGRRHRHPTQEETFVPLKGTLTMYLGEPPERHDVEVGGLIHVAPGTPLQAVNHGDTDLLVYVHGWPPEDEHAELLEPAVSSGSAADEAAISDVMTAFLRAVSFDQDRRPAYRDLLDVFIPAGRLIRNSGTSPQISTVEEFVAAREAAYEAGELRSFDEAELSARTEMFGNVAHRFSPYRKRAVSDRETIDARGVILTQFVRTPDGWRISSMAWDDE